ncbi:MAG TPA: hypothetical protein VLI39_02215 [Sedimentisphaerales bacterium]|nr:hypothetical protein [Sedimentisphaerales bacterium]
MSRIQSQSVVRNGLPLLIALAVFVPLARAAQPRTPLHSTASSTKKEAKAPSTASRAPTTPALRSPASFTPQMPLSEAVDILRNCTHPPLSIVVLWRSLDSAGIHQETPIGIDGLPGLRVRQYLDILVNSLSAGAADKIGYTVHGGVVTVGAMAALPSPRFQTRVYDISDLIAPPANYRLPPMGFGGLYGNQAMGQPGGYGGNLGTGLGMGVPPSMSGTFYSGVRPQPSGNSRSR